MLEHPSLTFQHWAGVSTYTSAFAFAGTCVFGKQSLGPLLCDHVKLKSFLTFTLMATLLPKLRVHFAEFLNEGSPAHLSILYPPTCVGTVRAALVSLEAFLDSVGSATSLASLLARHHASGLKFTDLPINFPTRLNRNFHSPDCLPFCVTPSLKRLVPVQECQPVVHRLRFLPRLRPRLTLRRRSLLRNP